MNKVGEQQAKVFQYVKGIHPASKGNYDAMVQLVSKLNKQVGEIKLSEETKRIMYLQLIAHSVHESCQSLITEIEDLETIEKIHLFQSEVKAFCHSWVTKVEITDFETLQERESLSFIHTWEKIVEGMNRQNGMIQ